MKLLKRSSKSSKHKRTPSCIVDLGHIDVNTLDTTLHLGFTIPKILATLRDQLDFTEGLKEEGIFRISASESEVASLLFDLNNGEGMQHIPNPHNAANLMKRWFKSWSGGRLLSSVPVSEFEKNKYLDVCKYLKPPRVDIWKWLLQLMVDIFAFREFNKMSARNIAIVWAPALFGSDNEEETLSSTLTLTQYGTALLEYLIENGGELLPIPIPTPAPTEQRMHATHSRSRSVADIEDSDISVVDVLLSPRSNEVGQNRRRTKGQRWGASGGAAPRAKPTSPRGATTPQGLFAPPPMLSSTAKSSHIQFTSLGDIHSLTEKAKAAALPPPLAVIPSSGSNGNISPLGTASPGLSSPPPSLTVPPPSLSASFGRVVPPPNLSSSVKIPPPSLKTPL